MTSSQGLGDGTETDFVPPSRPSAWVATRYGRLALALLLVELIAGMQSFMYSTIAPEIAQTFQAERLMGLIYSGVLASAFLTLPWGPKLLERFGLSNLMLGMTLVSCAGALLSAFSPNFGFFVAGQVLSGLSVGVLATASMSAVVQHLPARWRQVVLATFSATYIVSSIVGPLCAASIAHLFGWRWAMIIYIPFLLFARFVISRNTAELEPQKSVAPTPSILVSLMMPLAALLISTGGELPGGFAIATVLLGIVTVFVCAVQMLPSGTFGRVQGRPRGVRIFLVLTGIYFGMDAIIPLSLRSTLGASIAEVGIVLGAGGLAWAIVGFLCGRRPAAGDKGYVRRTKAGVVLLASGFIGIAVIVAIALPQSTYFVAAFWVIASIGMGLVYLDTMNLIFTPPPAGDNMKEIDAVSAVAFSEQIGAILFATPLAALAGFLISVGSGSILGFFIFVVAGFATALLFWVRPASVSMKVEN